MDEQFAIDSLDAAIRADEQRLQQLNEQLKDLKRAMSIQVAQHNGGRVSLTAIAAAVIIFVLNIGAFVNLYRIVTDFLVGEW